MRKRRKLVFVPSAHIRCIVVCREWECHHLVRLRASASYQHHHAWSSREFRHLRQKNPFVLFALLQNESEGSTIEAAHERHEEARAAHRVVAAAWLNRGNLPSAEARPFRPGSYVRSMDSRPSPPSAESGKPGSFRCSGYHVWRENNGGSPAESLSVSDSAGEDHRSRGSPAQRPAA